jgi:transposase
VLISLVVLPSGGFMETPTSSPPARPGTPGLDVFKIAGASISGYIPSDKTGDRKYIRQPYTSILEQRLSLYLEYHPHVRFYQRGDVSPAFASTHHLNTPFGAPYRISYVYDGKPHEYLPDYVGTLSDGSLLIAEAGQESEKSKGQALAKAEAARRLAQLKGGEYWIGTDQNLSVARHYNLLYLHARRQSFVTYNEIAAILLKDWAWGDLHTVNEFMQRFGSHWSETEVEAAVWKLVGDAAAEGRLLVDLTEVELSRSTPLALLEPGSPPILPDPLPSSLEKAEDESNELLSVRVASGNDALEDQGVILGPTFDASTLEKEEDRARFHRNLAAVTAVLTGKAQVSVAKEYNMAPSTLCYLVKRTQELGQIACVSNGSYHRDRALRPEFQQLIRKLYTQPLRPTVMAVYEDVRLKQLAEELSEREGTAVLSPTYWQVWKFLKAISHEAPVTQARSGLKHSPRERMSPQSFVLSIAYPAFICQVDEHTLDLLVVAADGTPITRRVHGAALICVKTGAILGAVLALDSLKEEDYMRLLKTSLEPKDRLTVLYECKHRWPCYGQPAIIFHDRGKIFTSEQATQVVVDRLKITTEQAPPFAPSAKGTVEALFTWTTRKFEHRLPGTTKATPQDRGAYESVREAQKAGITLDVLEKLFIQAIVDGYMQEWNSLRRQTPIALWEASVREKGVPRWMGSQDDLKLLLMKAVNRKNVETGRYTLHSHGGLSFLGHRYTSPGLLDRLRGKEFDIYYDRRDISVIYLFVDGILVGEAYCTEFLHRRVSIWEANAERRASAALKKAASAESLANRQHIQQEAAAGRRVHSLETKRLEKQRQLDLQRQEIHPSHVQARLQEESHQQLPVPSLRSQPSGILPPAVPEDDLEGRPIVHLPVRKRRRDDDPSST